MVTTDAFQPTKCPLYILPLKLSVIYVKLEDVNVTARSEAVATRPSRVGQLCDPAFTMADVLYISARQLPVMLQILRCNKHIIQ